MPPEESADKTRQKSCNACVRSKRRCDKRTPRCARCADKGVHCVYPNLPAENEQNPLARRAQQPSVVDAAEVEVNVAGDFFPSAPSTATIPSSSDQEMTPSSCSSESASFVDVTAGMDFDPADMDAMVLDPMMSLDGMQPGAYGEFGDFMNYMSVSVDGMQQGGEMRLWRTDAPPQAHALPEKPALPKDPSPPVLDHRFSEEGYREMITSACVSLTLSTIVFIQCLSPPPTHVVCLSMPSSSHASLSPTSLHFLIIILLLLSP